MKATNAQWYEALQQLRKGKTRPLGELLQTGAVVPKSVAILLGLMLAPPAYDTGLQLVVQKYKGKKPDGAREQASMVQANKEIFRALQQHDGVLKHALYEVGQDRKAQGLKSASRSKLYESWTGPSPEGGLAHTRRRLLEASLLPGADRWMRTETRSNVAKGLQSVVASAKKRKRR
jgi:hypothetical protein